MSELLPVDFTHDMPTTSFDVLFAGAPDNGPAPFDARNPSPRRFAGAAFRFRFKDASLVVEAHTTAGDAAVPTQRGQKRLVVPLIVNSQALAPPPDGMNFVSVPYLMQANPSTRKLRVFVGPQQELACDLSLAVPPRGAVTPWDTPLTLAFHFRTNPDQPYGFQGHHMWDIDPFSVLVPPLVGTQAPPKTAAGLPSNLAVWI